MLFIIIFIKLDMIFNKTKFFIDFFQQISFSLRKTSKKTTKCTI